MSIIFAAKCKPDSRLLSDIQDAGIEAVELYLSEEVMKKEGEVAKLCNDFPFRYCMHAPGDECDPANLASLADAIAAEVVVFHDIYWEDEWRQIIDSFSNIKAKLCVENVSSVIDSHKFQRRYGFGSCLDLEHLQMECAGVYEEVFLGAIKNTSHIHLTGYIYSTELWHTHIHHSPDHNLRILDLVAEANYSGLVVSEAKTSLQTVEEFRKLREFEIKWKNRNDK